MTPPPSSTRHPAATPAPSTTSPSPPCSPRSPPAKPSPTNPPPAPPSPKSRQNKHLSDNLNPKPRRHQPAGLPRATPRSPPMTPTRSCPMTGNSHVPGPGSGGGDCCGGDCGVGGGGGDAACCGACGVAVGADPLVECDRGVFQRGGGGGPGG